MTGSNPVSPASSGSPGSVSPPASSPAPPRPDGPPGPPEPPSLWDKTHAEIAEQAKHEAEVEHRVAEMKREGFWSLRRLPKVPEPARPKVHWDYLCEEMQWLAADFAQERRWKRGVARKVVRMVMRHHEEQRQKEERAKREEQAKLRRVAAAIAKEVKQFWSNVEKVVQFKQQSRLEEKRKKALDLQLDFIVGQTEKYSDLLSRSLNAPRRGPPNPHRHLPPQDGDTEPLDEDVTEGPPPEGRRREGEVPLEELLGSLPPQALLQRNKRPWEPREEDEEFAAEEEEGEDEEETIAAQERLEGDVDHKQELDDLAREGALPMEELLQQYAGAFADSDCDSPPGASSTRSDSPAAESDEEEEEEEDEDEEEEEEDEEEEEEDEEEEEEEEEEEQEETEAGAPATEDPSAPPGTQEHPGGPPPTAPQLPSTAPTPKKEITDIAAAAESLQPKGYTLATTQVKTPIPHLLRGTLREYQHIGLDWLVTMYEKKLNGILADEMGLGKTIQTISLLAHLACEKGSWGPHLIIVPTSVMLNWEMELKRWCPSFKILTYYGAQKERRLKRQGWTKPNAFHVCITSYKLVLQDHQAFRRKNWKYLILDEAQNIKNFKSQRWQSLLNFNSQRRLLLTGTPLQNSLMELWSLMHFLMPRVFQSHREFKEWFSNPLTGMIEGSQEYNESLVKRLHKVLRPFLLRRLKVDVEKQMPKKYEHVLKCRLSKRQRYLYDDFMGQASTKATLASGHFMSVINVLMQLRKVCNHPDLFEPRPVHSPFITEGICFVTASLVLRALDPDPFKHVDMGLFDLVTLEGRVSRYAADTFLPRWRVTRRLVEDVAAAPDPPPRPKPVRMKVNRMLQPIPKAESRAVLLLNTPRPGAGAPLGVLPLGHAPPPPGHAPQHPSHAPLSAGHAPLLVSPAPSGGVTLGPALLAAGPAPPAVGPAPPTGAPPPTATGPAPLLPPGGAGLGLGLALAAPPRATPTLLPALAPPPAGPAHALPPAPLAAPPPTAGAPRPPQPPPNLGGKGGPPLAAYALPGPGPQRLLLAPDMQARLPSGEVVSIGQLAALAQRPGGAPGGGGATPPGGAKPLTLQLQGSKLTLAAPPLRHLALAPPRGLPRNVVHLVAAGGQHPLLGPPAQVTLLAPVAPTAPTGAPPAGGPPQPPTIGLPIATAQVPTPLVNSGGVVKIVVRQAPRDGLAAPPVPPPAPPPAPRPPPAPPGRPLLRVVPGPSPAGVVPPPAATAAGPDLMAPAAPPAPPPTATPPGAPPAPPTAAAAPPREEPEGPGGPSPPPAPAPPRPPPRRQPPPPPRSPFYLESLEAKRVRGRAERLERLLRLNELRCGLAPVYGSEVLGLCTLAPPTPPPGGALAHAVLTPPQRLRQLQPLLDRFIFVLPAVEARGVALHSGRPPPWRQRQRARLEERLREELTPRGRALHRVLRSMRTHFPDLRLIQYDCGKLQTLDMLLRRLKAGAHRVLIFTQMTRMLDVLERFLTYHGHIYLRLDGSTRVEQRQALMERFNADKRIFCFILSTRSGGVGVNLAGADTVIFYDSDWNPTMDAQAQDRCHRIGQTRDVHIYRLISERTVEENILKKANQKRMLGDMAIEGGNFTTAYFKQQTIRELFDMAPEEPGRREPERDKEKDKDKEREGDIPPDEDEDPAATRRTHILEQALCGAEDPEDIRAASQAQAERVAALAEFSESLSPEEERGGPEPEEELSKAEQEIAALVEQLTPIERYAMNFLEASLEDISREELKQAEEQVEAARKDIDQAKGGGRFRLPPQEEEEEEAAATPGGDEGPGGPRRPRRVRGPPRPLPERAGTRVSQRLRAAGTANRATAPPSPRATPSSPRATPASPRVTPTSPRVTPTSPRTPPMSPRGAGTSPHPSPTPPATAAPVMLQANVVTSQATPLVTSQAAPVTLNAAPVMSHTAPLLPTPAATSPQAPPVTSPPASVTSSQPPRVISPVPPVTPQLAPATSQPPLPGTSQPAPAAAATSQPPPVTPSTPPPLPPPVTSSQAPVMSHPPPPLHPPPPPPLPPSSPVTLPPSDAAPSVTSPPSEASPVTAEGTAGGAGRGGGSGVPPPRRRRSADVEIRQSRGPGPAAKVLRQLPGRLVTVLETPVPGRPRRRRPHDPPAATATPSPSPGPPKRRRGRPPKRRGGPRRRHHHHHHHHHRHHEAPGKRRRGRPARGGSATPQSPGKRRRGRPPKRVSPDSSVSPPPAPRSTRRHPGAPLMAPLEREPGRRRRRSPPPSSEDGGSGDEGGRRRPPPAKRRRRAGGGGPRHGRRRPPARRGRQQRRQQPPRRCAATNTRSGGAVAAGGSPSPPDSPVASASALRGRKAKT